MTKLAARDDCKERSASELIDGSDISAIGRWRLVLPLYEERTNGTYQQQFRSIADERRAEQRCICIDRQLQHARIRKRESDLARDDTRADPSKS